MDALDIRILRELGMEPFVGWSQRPPGLSTSAVADTLDVGVHLVKDRIARMTADGVIVGYRLFPNLRHCGQGMTVCHLRSAEVPSEDNMARLGDVDGFHQIIWSLDSRLCINLSHASDAERRRRIQVMQRLVDDDDGPAKVLYTIDFPAVDHALSDLDWRIIRAMEPDAKRPLQEVADEVGVSSKTVRTRLKRMREEGSVDEYVALDMTKMGGVIPVQLALWPEPGAAPQEAIMRRFLDRYLAHFVPPAEEAYSPLQLRVFAYTPAEVQALVREALDVEGVERAEAFVATGGWVNPPWMAELLAAQVAAPLA